MVGCVVVLGDGEVYSVCARASIVVCIVISICATLRVVDFMPCVLLTSILVKGDMCAVMDYEEEGVNIGAS